MAVPEPGSDHQAPAVKNPGILGDFDRWASPDRCNAAVVDKDSAALQCDSCRRQINLRSYQGQILRAVDFAREQRQAQRKQGNKQKWKTLSRSHTMPSNCFRFFYWPTQRG